jgi:pimeloyl-ACP methyl ester carboxylesterase
VVVTGLTHGHGLGFLTLPTAIEPAGLDPQFLGVVPFLDAGYVTTIPGKRAGLFYSALADPAVIAYDEAHKDVMTVLVAAGAIASLTVPAGLNVSNAITAPVMLIVGEEDAPFCNVDVNCSTADGVRNHEAPYYTGAASLTVQTVAGTGHDLPLHPSGGTSFAAINAWMRSH